MMLFRDREHSMFCYSFQVFVNFARNQRESKLEGDPSFMRSSKQSRLQKIRNRCKKAKSNFLLPNKKKKARTRFTQLSTFTSSSTPTSPSTSSSYQGDDIEMPGDIGLTEDEVMLEEIDPLSIIDEESVSSCLCLPASYSFLQFAGPFNYARGIIE